MYFLRRLPANKHFRDNILFLAMSVIAFASEPAIANQSKREYDPINFTQALNLSRGNLSPASQDAVYLSHEDSCFLVQQEFAWEEESCQFIENIVFGHLPGIDTIILDKPNSEGFVKFDDWSKENSREEIDAIWDDFVKSSADQSEKLGYKITPSRWYVYPTLNKQKSYMYYAILMDWDGDPVINVKATLFDRLGYVTFRIVPVDSAIDSAELERLVEVTLNSYEPTKEQSYADFRDGDKIAAAGALGVLATLVGVKYGKAATAGIVAIILAFAKKLWFLIFIPFIFLKNMIFGKKN